MALVLETRRFAPKDRFEVVREAVWSSLVRVELEFDRERAIDADLTFHMLGPMAVCSADSNCTEIRRTPHLAKDDTEPAVFLGLQGAGWSAVEQGERQTVMREGTLAVYDSTTPYKLANHTGVNHHYFRIPKSELALPEDILARLIALQLDPANPVTRLLSTYLHALVAELATTPPLDVPALATPTIELIRAAVAAQFPDDPLVREPLRETMHHRIMIYLESHFADPDLSAAKIAAAHHVSVRQMYSVLAGAGVRLGDWVRARRLEQCRRELLDPRFAVATVARRWGFSSPAHFSRAFRDAYGMSPTEWRGR
jgi:AraC-like DNA-binding protein